MKRLAVVLAGALFTALAAWAMAALPPAAVDLRPAVAAHLAASGVEHPVTAVLLNYRGYDTLLEVAVLLLAVLGLLAAGAGGTAGDAAGPADPLLQGLARVAAPLMLVVALYLLWAGAFRPGGAFQAGAVLAAAAVLLHLGGLLPGWPPPGPVLRLGMALGLLVFLAVALALLGNGALLQYPPPQAGKLILLVESGLTLSLGLMLAGFFLLLSPGAGSRAP